MKLFRSVQNRILVDYKKFRDAITIRMKELNKSPEFENRKSYAKNLLNLNNIEAKPKMHITSKVFDKRAST